MPVPEPAGRPEPRMVLLRLDGVLHISDLPVQAFARHLCDALPAARHRPLIAGMRGFLEGKPGLVPPGIDLSGAEDGYQAVEMLARVALATDGDLANAHRASRVDLAASAWAIDPADGLDELLIAASSARVAVLAEPDDPAAGPVVREIGGLLDIASLADIEDPMVAGDPGRLLQVGARWNGGLAEAHQGGSRTALIDRFGSGIGTPTWRAPNLADLVAPVTEWLRGEPSGRLTG